MRFKVTGNMTAKHLALVLMKAMAEQGITMVTSANLYVGSGDGIIELNDDIGIPKTYVKPKKWTKPKGKKKNSVK
jgi:hypothetical protein